MGPTASGKSSFAEALAERLDAQLLNGDAFQVYRGFDIGTAKPLSRERYALIDLKDPEESFGVGEWIEAALAYLRVANEAGRSTIVVGGSGLYIRALMDDYADLAPPPDPDLRAELRARFETEGLAPLAQDLQSRFPDLAAQTDLRNPIRVLRALERAHTTAQPVRVQQPYRHKFKFGLVPDVEETEAAIEARLDAMLEAGWIDEVRRILEKGVPLDAPAMRAIGYSCLAKAIRGDVSLEEARRQIKVETRQYAKRQRTWLRREKGLVVLTEEDLDRAVQSALNLIQGQAKDG